MGRGVEGWFATLSRVTATAVAVAITVAIASTSATGLTACATGGDSSDEDAGARVWPDGAGLDGAALYAEKCAACHGEVGRGGLGPSLVDWSRGEDPLFSAIEARMPEGNPASCDASCAVAVGRYILASFTSEALACDEVAPSARRLRLLNRREYRNTIFDLFPTLRDGGAMPETEPPPDAPCGRTTFTYDPAGRTLSSVALAGSMNGWSTTAWPLELGARGVWETTRDLADGTHQYKLVLNGSEWVTDPTNPDGVDDGFGGRNSVIVVDCAGAGAGMGTGTGTGAETIGDPAASFPAEVRPDGFPFDDHADSGRVTAVHVDEQLAAADRIVAALGDRAMDLVPCDPATDASACASTFAETFGLRAFRRPLSPAEVARYRDVVLARPTFAEGVAVAIRAFLVSPSFLYRSEIGDDTPDADEVHALTSWEIASALSYGLWATMPDDALLAAARTDGLRTPDAIEREARRMLDDPRARGPVRDFARMWLGLEALRTAPKNAALYPRFDEDVRASMEEETERFVEHVVFESTGRYDELLTADYTFVNGALAPIYGMTAPAADAGFAETRYPDGRRAGLLGHASLLARYAHSDQSSPIQRGVFVRRNLLCQSFAQPPANAGGVPDVDPSATTRERFAAHTADPACASCHRFIDPVGFGFEHFDAIGAWRETESGEPVDAHGSMDDVNGLGTGTTAPFASLPELGAILAESDAAETCFARQYWRFAHGAREAAADRCAVAHLEDAFRESGGDIRELIIRVYTSPDFTRRR